jgi:CDP-diacylglycerol--serine O-phosphatidyltransferase
MDPLLPRLEVEERRRRRRLLFRHNKIPVRMLVPNLFTLLSLCAGLTAIRMAIELRYELAIVLVVIAALLDGVDGRLARALRAQSRFGAELDSLADFVNFGVAPAVIVFIWGLGGLPRGFGWIVALVFALATGLRLARFNTMIDVEKPKWQSEYFTGMPAPAGAITVLLPLYLDGLGLFDVRTWPWLIALYTAGMAALLVSTIPTFSGKLMGERISREYVLPAFVGVAALVALLVTYPYGTLTLVTLLYLSTIPMSYRRFQQKLQEPAPQATADIAAVRLPGESHPAGAGSAEPPASIVAMYCVNPAPSRGDMSTTPCVRTQPTRFVVTKLPGSINA